MSIIDQISDIEEQLQQIRRDGEQQVLDIKTKTDDKKRQMREHFSQEISDQSVILEKEMLQRVAEYKESFLDSNIKQTLQQQYNTKKEEIISQICKEFWRE